MVLLFLSLFSCPFLIIRKKIIKNMGRNQRREKEREEKRRRRPASSYYSTGSSFRLIFLNKLLPSIFSFSFFFLYSFSLSLSFILPLIPSFFLSVKSFSLPAHHQVTFPPLIIISFLLLSFFLSFRLSFSISLRLHKIKREEKEKEGKKMTV